MRNENRGLPEVWASLMRCETVIELQIEAPI